MIHVAVAILNSSLKKDLKKHKIRTILSENLKHMKKKDNRYRASFQNRKENNRDDDSNDDDNNSGDLLRGVTSA